MALIIDKQVENQMAVLRAASTQDSELSKRLRESIFQELKDARDRIAGGINFANGDPRGTARSVKRYTATKYLGGIVSLTDGKKTGGKNSYNAPRKVFPGKGGQRGGNRMLRSQRTEDILTTADRGFILRFVNSGTMPRYANGRNLTGKNNRRALYKLQEEGDYFRGSIAPRNFLETLGQPSMQTAMQNLEKIIDEEFEKIFK